MSAARLEGIDWDAAGSDLDRQGWTMLSKLLTADGCDAVAGMYGETPAFRSHVVMALHGFGKGEYRYFSYPLPAIVQDLRFGLYPALSPIANAWHARMGMDVRFPDIHEAFLERRHAAGQRRPTPLRLQYGPGDYNCLHQDLYGEHVFPLQVAVLLSEPPQPGAIGPDEQVQSLPIGELVILRAFGGVACVEVLESHGVLLPSWLALPPKIPPNANRRHGIQRHFARRLRSC